MQAYSEYKDSNIPWLGAVPSHWHLLPCRAIVSNQTDKNEDGSIEEYLSLMANIGVVRYEDKGDVGNKKPDDLSKCKLVKKGNLVINSMNYAIGSYGMSPYDGVCSPVYIVLELKEKVVERRFALRLFENKPMQKHLALLGNGILEHRAAIKWDDIKPQYIALPPLDEQRAILSFLDRETARIDNLIAEKQNFISLLKEKRQALISHVVTKGLDPNVKMKDSGIEWIGEVPEHWECVPLKRLVGFIEQGWSPECHSNTARNGYWGVLKSGAVNGGVYQETENKELPETQTPRPEIEVKQGDLIMSRASGSRELIGSAAYVYETCPRLMLSDKLFRLKCTKDVDPEFLSIALGSYPLRRQIELAIGGAEGLANNLSQANIKKLLLTRPPYDEQKLIVESLKVSLERHQNIISETQHSVELLKEHRTALISAVVTGKIDVREQI